MSDNLKRYIDEFFNNLELYDDFNNNHNYKSLIKASIDVFLESETPLNALNIYELFFMIYQITPEYKSHENINKIKEPNIPLDFAKLMFNHDEIIENSIQRNTFIHSANVFILGLAVYSQNETYRRTFKRYVIDSPYDKYYKDSSGEISDEEFLYRWGIASLFHDISLSIETMGKPLISSLNKEINSIFYNYGESLTINLLDLDELNSISKIDLSFTDRFNRDYLSSNFLDLFRPTHLMLHKLSVDFGLDLRQINILDNLFKEEYLSDHGFLSAVIILKVFGYIFQNYGLDSQDFFYPIVDSATAILLHNHYRNVLKKKPFNLHALHPKQNPLAFLLILCDELQEWNTQQPFAIKYKLKNQVNDLKIFITNDALDVNYIVKSGSMGLGFSEDKEEFLKQVLSMKSVFERGFNIFTHVRQDNNILRELVKSEIQAQNIVFQDIEKLAIRIHEQYNETVTQIYQQQKEAGSLSDATRENFENLTTFDKLSPILKLANIRQARMIPKKLNIIGCELASRYDNRESVEEFSQAEIIDLAIFEHDEWCREKFSAGWRYGPYRDDSKLIHNCLVPWEDLTPDIQQYDIDPVKNIPNLVNSIGLKIVRNKIRLLTVEMHNFYQSKEEGTVDFDDLPDHIKYANYKQVDFLVKNLNELDYVVVDSDYYGDAIDEFDESELEYFAQRGHNAWYTQKINLGWKYGPVRNDDLKINPNVVTWKNLNQNQKEINKLTFRSMPEMCRKLGLKIIKK